MVFGRVKAKISEQVNDRVIAPVRTAVAFSVAALLVSAFALIVAVHRASR